MCVCVYTESCISRVGAAIIVNHPARARGVDTSASAMGIIARVTRPAEYL